MRRRPFLKAAGAAAACTPVASATTPTAGSSRPQRKLIARTGVQDLWGEYPEFDKRLDLVTGLTDGMAAKADRPTRVRDVYR